MILKIVKLKILLMVVPLMEVSNQQSTIIGVCKFEKMLYSHIIGKLSIGNITILKYTHHYYINMIYLF